MHTPRPRPATVRQRGVRDGAIPTGNREPREWFVDLVRHVRQLKRPVLRGQRETNFDDRRKTTRSDFDVTRFEEGFAVVVLLSQPRAQGWPTVGEHVGLAGRRGGRVAPRRGGSIVRPREA